MKWVAGRGTGVGGRPIAECGLRIVAVNGRSFPSHPVTQSPSHPVTQAPAFAYVVHFALRAAHSILETADHNI